MIQKEQLLEFMMEKAYRPLTESELEEELALKTADEIQELKALLSRLEEEGEVVRTRTNRYGVPERMNLVRGRLQGHAKGFGFVIPEKSGGTDVYIHASDMNGALHGDVVLARINAKSSGRRLEGEIVRIIRRGNTRVVGTYHDDRHFGFVIPDDLRLNKDILITNEHSQGAVDGHKVVVEIISFPPERRAHPEGRVVQILGHRNDPGVDILSIIHKHGLPLEFPRELMEEVEAVPDQVGEAEIKGRRDLRDKKIVTIDGADAKDLDDAVIVERLANGNYLLGVHIADVSHYVREKSAIDQEAYNRGTSVYLVDRVIPMLPHRLSNGICSLNPQVERLTISCQMEIDAHTGEVKDYEIFPSVIRTVERMTYSDVNKILKEEDPELTDRYRELTDDFRLMEELALKLRNKRMNRGAIDFDFHEAKILVDEQGKPTDILLRDRSIAEQIIEEFMLKANETVAGHFHWLKKPFIYRVHERPDESKLHAFLEFINNFGYRVKGTSQSIRPRALQQLLDEVRGEPEETVISTVLLRSMKQARYDPQNEGHFGLSAEFYTHFTSPIRRYPDLIVHRLIRDAISGNLVDEREEKWQEKLQEIAIHSSERERIAVDAERETDDLKKAEYMLDKIGEEFTGLVSGVTAFGMFVELPNTVEGLVHISYLTDDYYHFHEKQYALVGERTGNTYRIGDEIAVRVISVNVEERSIDFEVVGMMPRRRRGDGGGGFAEREFGDGSHKWKKNGKKNGNKGKGGKHSGNGLRSGNAERAGGAERSGSVERSEGAELAQSGRPSGEQAGRDDKGKDKKGKKKEDTKPFWKKVAKNKKKGRVGGGAKKKHK